MTTTPELDALAAASSADIRQQNDAFRHCFATQHDDANGFFMTRGVSSLGGDFVFNAVSRVVSFDDFTDDNDPYGEHDFGAFTYSGEKLNWKIDYFDNAMKYGSPDPRNANVTKRVLTLMLAEEY